MKNTLIKNSLSGVVQSLLNIVLLFTVIPVFINMLGPEEYGVFSLIIIVGNLNVFTNLGLTRALIKFLAEQGKTKESNYDIIISFVVTIIILLPISLMVVYFNKFILLNILSIPITFYDDARIFYFYLLGANFLIIVGQVAKAVLDSGQRIVTTNLIQILYNLVYWGSILIVLLLGYHLPQVGFALFLAALIWFLTITSVSVKYWGKFTFSGFFDNYKRIARKQIAYGSKIYAGGLIGFFYEPLSKILISQFIGITEVGFFDIALRIKNQLWGIISKIFYPLFPLISSMKEKGKIKFLVHDLEQKTFFIIVPIVSIIIFTSYSFVQLWIGHNVKIISVSVQTITSAFLVGSITTVPNYQFLIAKGHADKTIKLQLVNVIINAVIFILTFKLLGYYAAILANATAIMSSFLLSLYYQKKYLNSLIFDSWHQISKLFLLAFVNLCFGYLLNLTLQTDLSKLLIIPPSLIIASILSFRFLKFFTKEDLDRYLGNSIKLRTIGEKLLLPAAR